MSQVLSFPLPVMSPSVVVTYSTLLLKFWDFWVYMHVLCGRSQRTIDFRYNTGHSTYKRAIKLPRCVVKSCCRRFTPYVRNEAVRCRRHFQIFFSFLCEELPSLVHSLAGWLANELRNCLRYWVHAALLKEKKKVVGLLTESLILKILTAAW